MLRTDKPEEIAHVALILAIAESSFINVAISSSSCWLDYYP